MVGVVRDMKDVEGFSQSIIYLPLTPRDFARPPAGGITILVRSDAGADALSGIRNEIAFIDPNLNIFNVQTLSAYLDRSRASLRFLCPKLRRHWSVRPDIGRHRTRRSHGVRGGATAQGNRHPHGAGRDVSAQVLRLVLREGAALVSVGTVLGFLGAMALAKILAALASLFVDALTIGTNDPRLLIGAPLLLAAVAMLACYVPARRSAQIDPLQALREE